jgi:hypothetical protein
MALTGHELRCNSEGGAQRQSAQAKKMDAVPLSYPYRVTEQQESPKI